MSEARVRFVDGSANLLSELQINSVDQPGLLQGVTSALFDLRVQLVRFETQVRGSDVRAQLFLVEFDGAPIRPRRRSEIQSAVLDAVERVTLSRSTPAARLGLARVAECGSAK
jgi:UTP:GlnB (protein PII) uridylyltransferase